MVTVHITACPGCNQPLEGGETATCACGAVVVQGAASYMALGSSRVWAFDSSVVRALDSSKVRALGSSTVRAFGSSVVWAYDSSKVEAQGSSTVWAFDSSKVEALDSSKVEAHSSSVVRARGSSVVRAFGSSRVEAFDSSTVWAYQNSKVEDNRASHDREGERTITQHRDHYGDYIDLLRCHDALLEAATALLIFTPNENGWSNGGGSDWVQRFHRAADQLRAAIAAAAEGRQAS